MKPLPWIAMGLVIVALSAQARGVDLLADPVGWLLVLLGVHRFGRLPSAVTWLALVALVVSGFLWWPGAADALADRDPALVWAASVPELATMAALCAGLARVAGPAGDRRARAWLGTAAVLAVVTALAPLPVLAVERDIESVLLLGLVTVVAVIVLLFRYSSRPWAVVESDRTTAAARPRSR
ncbi:hypothetical protein [Nocardioides pyridinolyticus]